MPPSLHFHLVYTGAEDYARDTHPGIVQISNGDLICGHQYLDGGGALRMEFLGSSNGGSSWDTRSNLIGGTLNPQCRLAHLPGNVLLYPAQDADTNESMIYRSTDSARTWTLVHNFNPAVLQNRPYQCQTITAYGRDSALAYGLLAHATNDGINSTFARSTDFGVTWTLLDLTLTGSMNLQARGISPGGAGAMMAAQYRQGFYLSTDNGIAWTGPAALTLPTGVDEMFASQSTWITPQIVLAAGGFLSDLDPQPPALYRSTDAGATWSIIPAGNIEDWPTGPIPTTIFSLARITRDGALLGWSRNSFGSPIPLRYSVDAGLHWLTPSSDSYPWANAKPAAAGATTITPAGRILVSLPTQTTTTWQHNIWSGEITC